MKVDTTVLKTISENTLSELDLQSADFLNIARGAIEDYLRHNFVKPTVKSFTEISQFGGVFVTLWSVNETNYESMSKNDEVLRGCVGRVGTGTQLVKTIQESAVSAATKDPRFSPVVLSELDHLRIEISILSLLQEVESLDEIIIGKHGLLIDGNKRRGLLLPKVAERLGWNKYSFLHGVCTKAGLPDDCWPDHAKLFRFTAYTIAEKAHK